MAGDKDSMGISATTTGPAVAASGHPDRMARLGGGLLLVTAIAMAVMVFGRVAASADQPTLAGSLLAVAENRGMYGLFGAARLASGLTLLAAGWFLLRAWIIRDRWATPWVPYLFVASGVCTIVSGVCVLLIAVPAESAAVSGTAGNGIVVVDDLRWLSGKVGFTAAGLALIVAAWFQWQVGGALRKVAPASVALGVAMQFIWLDAATIVHPIVGGLFCLWLLVIGTMLATGRVERHFIARYGDLTATGKAQMPGEG